MCNIIREKNSRGAEKMRSLVSPIAIVTPINKVLYSSNFHALRTRNANCRRFSKQKLTRSCAFVTRSVSSEDNTTFGLDVSFPDDYSELLDQAKLATELALQDGKQLMEIEFPTSGLESVPGDGEGGIEMTGSMQLIREFYFSKVVGNITVCREILIGNAEFFPEAKEVEFARGSSFGGASFKLDYLTKPSIFEDFGFVTKVKMADRVKPEDEMFIVGYPYFNVTEMLVVDELYKEAVANTSRKMIIFNGELDRIRSGYYPAFFYPKLAALCKTLFPKMETVYYIHNFKGYKGGVLFRCYPGPWKVLRKMKDKYVCLHQQETMPSLKEVALNILPSS